MAWPSAVVGSSGKTSKPASVRALFTQTVRKAKSKGLRTKKQEGLQEFVSSQPGLYTTTHARKEAFSRVPKDEGGGGLVPWGSRARNVWASAFREVDSAIHRINHCPADSVVCFVKVIPLKLFYYQTFFETWPHEHS